MTYNIKRGRDLGKIAEVIRSYAPDLVALQEIEADAEIDQAAELACRLDMEMRFAATLESHGHRYGIATLTRLPTLEARQIFLPAHLRLRSEPRCALATRHRWASGVLELLNTHLSTLFRERPGQLAAIASEFVGESLIIAGDFNCTPWSPAFRALRRHRLSSATRFARTWPAPAPFVPIDHILYRGPLALVSAGTWKQGPVRRASDHLPVVAELEYREAA